LDELLGDTSKEAGTSGLLTSEVGETRAGAGRRAAGEPLGPELEAAGEHSVPS
jgi:hypothetical protein